ncbi:hypothetical protein BDR26DRAFT_1004497 [Obelidium mucronatum]|nr:hypothetical protein BDR26DRAFT_1004497 [Obelidium mucronatum]
MATTTLAAAATATLAPPPRVINIGDTCSGVGKLCGIQNNTVLWCGDSTGSANAAAATATTATAAAPTAGTCGLAAGPYAACAGGVAVCYPGMRCVSGRCDPPVSAIGGTCNAQWQFNFHVCPLGAACVNLDPTKESNACADVAPGAAPLPTANGAAFCVADPTRAAVCRGAPFCFSAAPAPNNSLSEAAFFCRTPGTSAQGPNVTKSVDLAAVAAAAAEVASVAPATATAKTSAPVTTAKSGSSSFVPLAALLFAALLFAF